MKIFFKDDLSINDIKKYVMYSIDVTDDINSVFDDLILGYIEIDIQNDISHLLDIGVFKTPIMYGRFWTYDSDYYTYGILKLVSDDGSNPTCHCFDENFKFVDKFYNFEPIVIAESIFNGIQSRIFKLGNNGNYLHLDFILNNKQLD